jgi:hypothetical protein
VVGVVGVPVVSPGPAEKKTAGGESRAAATAPLPSVCVPPRPLTLAGGDEPGRRRGEGAVASLRRQARDVLRLVRDATVVGERGAVELVDEAPGADSGKRSRGVGDVADALAGTERAERLVEGDGGVLRVLEAQGADHGDVVLAADEVAVRGNVEEEEGGRASRDVVRPGLHTTRGVAMRMGWGRLVLATHANLATVARRQNSRADAVRSYREVADLAVNEGGASGNCAD